MEAMGEDLGAAPSGEVDEGDREAVVSRLAELFSVGALTHRAFGEALDEVFAARSRSELEGVVSGLPSVVRLTRVSERLDRPLRLQPTTGGLHLTPGWQLATDTTLTGGAQALRLDLTGASWDGPEVRLHLETWGSIDVLVAPGVAVQVLDGAGRIELTSLAPALPGGPVLRISMTGPAGVVRVSHPNEMPPRPSGRRR